MQLITFIILSYYTKHATACVYYLNFTMLNVQVFIFFFYLAVLNLQVTFVTFILLYQMCSLLHYHHLTVLNVQLIPMWKTVQLWHFVHHIK
jgi:hypothetical protein